MEEDALEVERLYSTKPIRVVLGPREYLIPVNHFTEKGADRPGVFVAKNGFGFVLFLPDFGGFTKENWQKGWFDTNRIDVIELKLVDKEAIVPIAGGGHQKITPANYGEPRARFENRKSRLEAKPSLHAYGVEGYRWRSGQSGITWTGTRTNGEFLYFEAMSAPGEPLPPGTSYPLCTVRYYSDAEDLYVSYIYPQHHIHRWKQIDDAIWHKVKKWRVK